MYDYQTEKPRIFAEDNQQDFLKVRDNVQRLLGIAGAVRMSEAIQGISGSSWFQLACVDRLVELGEIREITGEDVAGQDRVFVRAKRR